WRTARTCGAAARRSAGGLALLGVVVALAGPWREQKQDPGAVIRGDRTPLTRIEPGERSRLRLDALAAGFVAHTTVEHEHPRARAQRRALCRDTRHACRCRPCCGARRPGGRDRRARLRAAARAHAG